MAFTNADYRQLHILDSHEDLAIGSREFRVSTAQLIFYPPAIEEPGSRWRVETPAPVAATLREPG